MTQVAETYAVAVLENAPDGQAVRAGDKVRITAGRLTLALIPVSDQTERGPTATELVDAVRRGLDASGRFIVLPRARLTLWLLERGLAHGGPSGT